MKELTVKELALVSGGVVGCSIGGGLAVGGSMRGGQELGRTVAFQAGWDGDKTTKAARWGGGAGLALVGGLFVGRCAYDHIPAVREGAIGIVESIHLWFPNHNDERGGGGYSPASQDERVDRYR